MLTKPGYYYVIPNKLYRLDGIEVETVRYNKMSGYVEWKYRNGKEVRQGKLGVDLFIKNPLEKKIEPSEGVYVKPGCKVKLFNMQTRETGWYTIVHKRGDTTIIPPIRTTGGKYYGELTVNSFFGQELLYLQEHDVAVYYTTEGKVKMYRVEKIENVKSLYE